LFDESEILFSYKPDENRRDYFDVKTGIWHYKNGALIGWEPFFQKYDPQF
jgi:hypothetical protein